jgi:hypothetical protein
VRNLTYCDIRLHAATEAAAFERAMLHDVLPGAGPRSQPPGAPFIRSLYRDGGRGRLPRYRCIVNSSSSGGRDLFGLRPRIRALGADPSAPRFRPVAAVLPDDATATYLVRVGASRGLVAAELLRRSAAAPEQFERELLAALDGEVGVRTRAADVHAAFCVRDERAAGAYGVAVLGEFTRPALRLDTVERIEAAGGRFGQTRIYHHIGTVAAV